MSGEFTDAALKLLMDTGNKAASSAGKFHILEMPNQRKYAEVYHDGTVEINDLPNPRREHELLSIEDVSAWSAQQAKDHEVIIWVGHERIIVTLDDKRLAGDRASYSFEESEEFELLSKLAKQDDDDAFDQRSLLKALRTTFWSSFQNDSKRDDLIRQLRKVTAEQRSEIGQGRGTFEAGMVTSDGESIAWPERLAMKVRAYTDPCLMKAMPVDVVFEVNAQKKEFSLWPTKASIRDALNASQEQAVDQLRNSVEAIPSISVYLGQP